jgi:hypothetical protein
MGVAGVAVAAYVGVARGGHWSPLASTVESGPRVDEPPAGAPPPPAPGDQTAEIARLRHEVALMRLEMAATRDRTAREPDARGGAPTPAAGTERPDHREIEEAAASWHARMEEVSTSFQNEPYDPHWAAGMVATVKEAATRHDAINKALQNIDCRSQTCRVELKYDGSRELDEQLPFFVQETGRDLPTMQADQIDVRSPGPKTLVMYLNKATKTQR